MCCAAHALKTFYCTLGTRVNPDIIGWVWTGEFDLHTLRVDGQTFESRKKKLRIKKYLETCGRGLLKVHQRKYSNQLLGVCLRLNEHAIANVG